jgi:hypothetical protein
MVADLEQATYLAPIAGRALSGDFTAVFRRALGVVSESGIEVIATGR